MRLQSDYRDLTNVPPDMLDYLRYRIEALSKRVEELEEENAALRRELEEEE